MKKIILLMLICLIPIVFAAKIINVKAPDPAYQNQENTFTEDNYFEDIYVKNIEVEFNATIINYTVVNQTLAQDITASGIIEAGDAGTGCQLNGVPSTLFCYDGMKIYTVLDSLNYWATAEGSYLSRDNLLNIEGDINSSSKITAGDTVFAPIVQGGDAGKGGQFGGLAGAAFIYNGMEMMSFETGDYHFVTDGNSYLDDDENLNIGGWVNVSGSIDAGGIDNGYIGVRYEEDDTDYALRIGNHPSIDNYGQIYSDRTVLLYAGGNNYIGYLSSNGISYVGGKQMSLGTSGIAKNGGILGYWSTPAGGESVYEARIVVPDTVYTTGWGIGRGLIISDAGDYTYDWEHRNRSNPTVYIHSANQVKDEFMSLSHNSTAGVIESAQNRTVIHGNLSAIDTIRSEDMIAEDDITAAGTVQAEHLYSTDDAEITDNLDVNGQIHIVLEDGSGEDECCYDMFNDNCDSAVSGEQCFVYSDQSVCMGIYYDSDWWIINDGQWNNAPMCMGAP